MLAVRQLILKNWTDCNEGIEWGMLSFGDESKNIFHLTAQKGYVSLYVGDTNKVENADKMLDGFDRGKGCIRIKKSLDLSATKLEAFILGTIALHKAGGNMDC